jgi:hypothetical protein
MCYFITVALPQAKASWFEETIPRGIAVFPSVNDSITRHLPPGYRTYALTSGGCSCGLFNDPHSVIDVRKAKIDLWNAKLATKARQYQHKGWSSARVARAMAQATRAHATRADPEPWVGLEPMVRRLLAKVAEDVGELAVVAHFFSGGVETERYHVTVGPTISPKALETGQPPLEQDQLLFVKRTGRT